MNKINVYFKKIFLIFIAKPIVHCRMQHLKFGYHPHVMLTKLIVVVLMFIGLRMRSNVVFVVVESRKNGTST